MTGQLSSELLQEAKDQIQVLKDQGNQQFKDQNFLKSAATYTKAIKIVQDTGFDKVEYVVLYSNRSAALLKVNKISKALQDAEEAIALKPEWDKGYFRKGSILEIIEDYQEALTAYQHALQLSSDNQEIKQKVRLLQKKLQRSQQQQQSKKQQENGKLQNGGNSNQHNKQKQSENQLQENT